MHSSCGLYELHPGTTNVGNFLYKSSCNLLVTFNPSFVDSMTMWVCIGFRIVIESSLDLCLSVCLPFSLSIRQSLYLSIHVFIQSIVYFLLLSVWETFELGPEKRRQACHGRISAYFAIQRSGLYDRSFFKPAISSLESLFHQSNPHLPKVGEISVPRSKDLCGRYYTASRLNGCPTAL